MNTSIFPAVIVLVGIILDIVLKREKIPRVLYVIGLSLATTLSIFEKDYVDALFSAVMLAILYFRFYKRRLL